MPSKTYNKAQDERNREAALERDNYECVWCRHRLGVHSPPTTPHHIFGRRRDHSEEAQITLCMIRSKPDSKGRTIGCHDRYHHATEDENGEIEITTEKLIELMGEIYGYTYEQPATKIGRL